MRPLASGFVLRLREGTADDLDWARRWHHRFYVSSGRYGPVFGRYVDDSVQAHVVAGMPGRSWVAESAGTRVGFIAWSPRSKGSRLRWFLVEEAVRGQGIGGTLLAALLADAPRPITLWTMADLADARRLYEAHGFRLVEEAEAPWARGVPQQRFDLG